jgi:hypothetical protein
LLWSLRVQERINALAQQSGWPLELTWNGFRKPGSEDGLVKLDPAIESAVRGSLRGLLRRFVSNEWIDCRLRRDDSIMSGN